MQPLPTMDEVAKKSQEALLRRPLYRESAVVPLRWAAD